MLLPANLSQQKGHVGALGKAAMDDVHARCRLETSTDMISSTVLIVDDLHAMPNTRRPGLGRSHETD